MNKKFIYVTLTYIVMYFVISVLVPLIYKYFIGGIFDYDLSRIFLWSSHVLFIGFGMFKITNNLLYWIFNLCVYYVLLFIPLLNMDTNIKLGISFFIGRLFFLEIVIWLIILGINTILGRKKWY